ncbi:uncharacterized protein LOC108415858 [Pygocentrus nattereri]|uniref:uncharacterized protein LOC108415858 n=1 Tax=Pygocentrus nattereri TaxID=42514 RepID=UPI0018914CAB|nr:uncharacterized protein LOC108415858 [Pygocentrus nattereri]
MASVLRWAVVYWTLTQVFLLCGALGSPVHVQLNVDGTDDARLTKMKGLIKIRYNPQDTDASVETAELVKLYVTGKFSEVDKNKDENVYFNWDNIKISGKELGEFVLRKFKGDPVVIVVFPNDLQTPHGFQFQKEFEEEVQKTNDRITVGRGVINVYVGFDLQNLDEKVKTLLETKVFDHEKDEKYYSIFAQYHQNKFSFRTVFTAWRTEPKPVNIFQVKIQEADSVAVKLISACTSDNGLKVGSHTAKGLTDILLKLLRVQDVETHPEQRIRVELPETCWTAKDTEAFTGDLVDNLNNKLKVYGKEPSVHIHVYSKDDTSDTNDIKDLHKQDIFGKINGQISLDLNQKSAPTLVSSAKELFIHIHCHGLFGKFPTICGKDSGTLAGILSQFIKTLLINSVTKNGIIIFHVCNAGSEHGQEYVKNFLTNINNSLQPHNILIQESLSYKNFVSLILGNTMVSLPCSEEPNPLYWPKAPEKQVFARFTVRTIKTTQGFKAFSLLPLTEYNLIYKM